MEGLSKTAMGISTISFTPDMEVGLDSGGDVVSDLWHGRFLGFFAELDQFGEVSIDESAWEARDTLGLEHPPYPALAPPNRVECSPETVEERSRQHKQHRKQRFFGQ